MKFVIVSGYCDACNNTIRQDAGFLNIWLANTRKLLPYKTYIINVSKDRFDGNVSCEWINSENLGHVHNITKDQRIGGWSASFLMGCLLSYHCKSDMLYKESDCLTFGPVVDRLYDEIGNKGMITGKPNGAGPACGLIGQSLVLVKHRFLLDFLSLYAGIPHSESVTHGENDNHCPERKFARIAGQTGEIVQTTMGYDRTRPIGYDDKAFYVQQLVPSELAELNKRGLI